MKVETLSTGQQVAIGDDIALGRGRDISGQVFGDLTAIRIVSKSQLGNLWLCSCACGRFAARYVSSLSGSVKRGSSPACYVCNAETFRGYKLDKQARIAARQTERHILNFALRGSLWSPEDEDAMQADIVDGITALIGVAPEAHLDEHQRGYTLKEAIDLLGHKNKRSEESIQASKIGAAAHRQLVEREVEIELERLREAKKKELVIELATKNYKPTRSKTRFERLVSFTKALDALLVRAERKRKRGK